ncbi:hypothetical protein QBC39DRAFT_96515 [Podospora conica]|nr:hypothetical protein QBC39DRAFT_96515 [Schizothecium conicum]
MCPPRWASSRSWARVGGSDAVRIRLTFESKAPAKNKKGKNNCRITPLPSPNLPPTALLASHNTGVDKILPDFHAASLSRFSESPLPITSHFSHPPPPSRPKWPPSLASPTDEPRRTISLGRRRHHGSAPLARCHGRTQSLGRRSSIRPVAQQQPLRFERDRNSPLPRLGRDLRPSSASSQQSLSPPPLSGVVRQTGGIDRATAVGLSASC